MSPTPLPSSSSCSPAWGGGTPPCPPPASEPTHDPLDAPLWHWEDQPLAPRRPPEADGALDGAGLGGAAPARGQAELDLPQERAAGDEGAGASRAPGDAVKEVCRLIREARTAWDAHHNAACRRLRARAMQAYERLSTEERERVPQVLRVWLRYRSEKYFGPQRSR